MGNFTVSLKNRNFISKIRISKVTDYAALSIDVLTDAEVLKKACLTQLSMKFILLINVKMPTIVGILTFISMINTLSETLKVIYFFRHFFPASYSLSDETVAPSSEKL